MKNHLLKHFTEQATQHVALAKSCKAMASHFASLAECAKAAKSEMEDTETTDVATLCANASNEFKTQSEAHTAAAENCLEMCKALKESKKAMIGDFDPDALVPTEISAIVPDRARIRSVPRYGTPTIADAEANYLIAKVFGGTDEE